jgi:hypothetical protein
MVNPGENPRDTLRINIQETLRSKKEYIGGAFIPLNLPERNPNAAHDTIVVVEDDNSNYVATITLSAETFNKHQRELKDKSYVDLLLRRLRKCLLQLMEVEDDLKKIATLTIKADTFEKSITFKQKFINSEIQFLVFQKRVDVLIEEYKTLRQEILQHLSVLDTLLSYSFIAIAGSFSIIGYLYTNDSNKLLFKDYSHNIAIFCISLLIPSILFLINQMRLAKAIKIAQIGYYLSSVELEINHAFNNLNYLGKYQNSPFFEKYELDIFWERYLRTIRGNPHIGQNRRNLVGIYEELLLSTCFFSLFGFSSIVLAYQLKENSVGIEDSIVNVGLVFFLLLNGFSFLQFHKTQEWQKAITYGDKVTRIGLNPLEIFMKDLKQSLEKLFNNTDNK